MISTSGACLSQLVRRALQQRKRSVVAWDAARRAEQLERDPGLARVHREVAADRQDRHVGRVDPRDQLHVAEDAGVAGEVELRPVLELRARSRQPRPGSRPRPSALEWKAFTSVELDARRPRPCRPCSRPAARPARRPAAASQALSSTIRHDRRGLNCLLSSTVSPTWSPCPCVIAIRSIRSGSFSESGHFGLPSQGST